MTCGVVILAAVLNLQKGGVDLSVEAEPMTIDPGRNVTVTLTAKAPADVEVVLPDLMPRLRGFSDAEPLETGAVTGKDGKVTRTVLWRLVPEPCAAEYKIAPFVVGVVRRGADASFVAGPVRFTLAESTPPEADEMALALEKDKPAWTLRRARNALLWGLLALAVLTALVLLALFLMRRVKEHRMRPIDRAWVELDRLLKRDLPGRGRYKDFYVELTQVVRRYIQRQHGVRAPHLTTEEFFEVTRNAPTFPRSTLDELIDFLRKADMVKFAGITATTETAAGAVTSARAYIDKDNTLVLKKEKTKR